MQLYKHLEKVSRKVNLGGYNLQIPSIYLWRGRYWWKASKYKFCVRTNNLLQVPSK